GGAARPGGGGVVPGWGRQLDPARVLGEMRPLGIAATEAGPDGYLGTDIEAARALLARHGLNLVGGFLPVVLHDPARLDVTLAKVREKAAFFAALGAEFPNSAAVVDGGWSPRVELHDAPWGHLLRVLTPIHEAAPQPRA